VGENRGGLYQPPFLTFNEGVIDLGAREFWLNRGNSGPGV
jgi:hypothetical protein